MLEKNRKIRVALIGPSRSSDGYGLGAYILNEIIVNPQSELIALGGRSKKRLKKSLELENIKDNSIKLFNHKNIKSLFNMKEIDLVIVATPTKTHLKYVQLAIQNNKNVLVEKPLVYLPTLVYKNKDNTIERVFSEAKLKKIRISTLCQKSLVYKKVNAKLVENFLEIKMVFGKKNIDLDSEKFFLETISHPLSILIKFGFSNLKKFKKISCKKLDSTEYLNSLIFSLYYKKIEINIILYQSKIEMTAETEIIYDETKINVSSEMVNHKYKTVYTTENNKEIEEEELRLSVKRMISSINSKKQKPVISNIESLKIHKLEKIFFKSFIMK